jgi:hypothetical protein
MLEDANIWSRLTGGGIRRREYAKDLVNHPLALAVITKAMKSYVGQVQEKYPSLTHVKYGALRTFPNERSQYLRHEYKLHLDYTVDCKNLPPSQRPISIIVALDPFELIYLPTKLASRRELVRTTIFPGQMVMFTDNCLHSGGSNRTSRKVYRLFAYLASRLKDIPLNGVSKYAFTDNSNNAVIADISNGEKSRKQRWQGKVPAYISRSSR